VRVLVVSTDYPPHREGGYELHCRAAVEHLRAAGHEVGVLTSARDGFRGDDALRTLTRFAPIAQDVSVTTARRAVGRLGAALDEALDLAGPDVVSFWRLGELSMSLVERVARAGLPAVGMVCDPWMLDGPERDPWNRIRGHRPAFGAAARWLFVSETLRRQVCARMPLPDAGVVHAGIDLERLPLRDERPWSGRLLYAGRLSPLKGVDTAIRAVAALPGAQLDVVGAGPALEDLQALAASLGCAERVVFRGAVDPRRMGPVYARADAVLFPSAWEEPWGLVPLEAMACGVPVVASGTGGSAEYLRNGENALVARDAEAIALAVRRLAADGALRSRLRVAGRATAERFPTEASSAAILAELEAAVSARRSARAAR
jgi:glycosyltransferase involved in cell wall biosynthesis